MSLVGVFGVIWDMYRVVIREVMKSDLPETEKQKIIMCGMDVLAGGEGSL